MGTNQLQYLFFFFSKKYGTFAIRIEAVLENHSLGRKKATIGVLCINIKL